jgi:parvulin-like peptidyl-prolyl isomerase
VNRRRTIAAPSLLILALFACAALAQAPARRPAAPVPAAPAGNPPVATVAGRPVPRAELDLRMKQFTEDYARRKGGELPAQMQDVVRRQVLESLIRSQLMTLEARRLGMYASEAEGEEALKQLPVFATAGRFDPSRYQALKTLQPAQFNAALTGIRDQLAARKLALTMEQRVSPSENVIRAEAARALSRVTVEMLQLRTSDFAGTFDEPRESQVEEAYRAHLRDYQREARASLTIAFVNTPSLAESLRGSSAAAAEWNRSMRTMAEGIIERVRKGEGLDSAAASVGSRGKIIVAADNFPGYWRGTPAQSARLFVPGSVGQVLPEPVKSNDGWLVVRVDDVTPAYLAPLREVAREVRAGLRNQRRLHRDEDEQLALYGRVRDSLAAPGWPIRYAAVDTATLVVAEPGPQELDTYYRAHQADYASFDPKSGGILTTPLAEVRDEVRNRFVRDRRDLEARALADQLWRTWASGRRDAGLESRLGARTTAAKTAGSRIDTGLVARVLSDTIWTFPTLQGGVLPYPRGFIVWQGLARVDKVTPSFAEAQGALARRLAVEREAADVAGGRALFDADPARFRKGDVVHYTRVAFPLAPRISMPLTRDEVERWYRDHIEKYSAPEMVTARHILIIPSSSTPAADREALEKAKSLLRRIQGGEDFVTLAQAYSEDPATRGLGGDLGSFARGVLLEPFEKVAFRLAPGTLYDQPVKTEVGYHILKVTDHAPPESKPLARIYSAVSADAAQAKSVLWSEQRADSVMRLSKSPRGLVETARRAGAEVLGFEFGMDDPVPDTDVKPFFAALRATPAGKIVPGTFTVKGLGTWAAVVDSITPARTPTWEKARTEAVAQYRREAGSRALETKRAELDSLLAGGMSLDSLAAYWGGLQRVTDLAAGRGLPNSGSSDEVDSLLYGGRRSEPGLPSGAESGWVRTSTGLTRLRLVSRTTPSASQVADRAEQMRRAAVEMKLGGYFDELRSRYPVVILDRRLRDTSLLPVPQQFQAP